MAAVLQPSGAWIRVDLVLMDDAALMRQSAKRPWPDPDSWYDGLKHQEIITFGDAVRELSDPDTGSPVVSTFTVDLFDPRGWWRALLRDWNTLHLTAHELTYFFASEQLHFTRSTDPRVEFRGQIKQPQVLPNRGFRLTAESRIGTRFGPFNMDGAVLKRGYDPADFPNLPRENHNVAVSMLWGEMSDEGLVNSAGEDIAQGAFTKVIGCGIVDTNPTNPNPENPPEPLYLQPPTLSITVTGSGSSYVVDAVVVLTLDNGTTTGPSNVVHVTNYPRVPSGSYYATWDWAQAVATIAYKDRVISSAVYAKRIGIDSRYYKLDAGGMFPDKTGGQYVHNGTAPGDDAFGKAMYPPPPETNTAIVGTTTGGTETAGTPKRFYGLLAFTGTIISIFGLNLAPIPEDDAGTTEGSEDETGSGRPQYSRVTADEIGSTFDLGAGGSGYTLVKNGHTYWGFFAEGPRADAHDDGTAPFRVNLCGRHVDHDPDQPIIDQLAYIWQDVIEQTTGPDGKGYQTGPPLTVPYFQSDPTIPMIKTSSVEAVQQVTIDEMGTAKGAVGCVLIDSYDVTYRSFIEQICRDGSFDYGETAEGQMMLSIMRGTGEADEGLLLREAREIRRVNSGGGADDEHIYTEVRFQWRRDADGNFLSGIKKITDEDAERGYRGKRDIQLDMAYINNYETAVWSASRFLAFRTVAPSYPEVVCRLEDVLNVELGERHRIDHPDVADEVVAVYLRKKAVSETNGEVTLMGRDLTFVLLDTFAVDGLGDDTVPDDEIDDGNILLGDESVSAPYGSGGAARLA